MYALENLDYPKSKIKLLWFTNADKSFVDCLRQYAKKFRKQGYEVKIVHDQSLPVAFRVFNDGDQRSDEHLNVIAALYNAAWQYVDTDDVLLLEDDVIAPSHALKRLKRHMDSIKTAGIISGCVFDRHRHGVMFVWDLRTDTFCVDGQLKTVYKLVPVANPWGVRKVGYTGFSCTLIRKSRLPVSLTEKKYPFTPVNPVREKAHIGGVDLVFCEEAGNAYADFDVRASHIDSQAQLH